MNTHAIDPIKVSEGRTLLTLTPTNADPGSEHLVGPVHFPKQVPDFVITTKKPATTGKGYWQCWTNEHPWKDAIAYWDGVKWLGKASEVAEFSKPGYMRSLGQNPCGVRPGSEVWPDPAVVCDGLGVSGDNDSLMEWRTQITASLWDCPAEMLVVKNTVGEGCDFHIHGTACRVRVHGNRPAVLQVGPGANRYFFYNVESLAGLIRCDHAGSGPYPTAFGSGKCLALLSDMGGLYLEGEGLDFQGGFGECDIDLEQLPRMAPTVKIGTVGAYLDNSVCGVNVGKVRTKGFTEAARNGGGSFNDLSQVTGGTVVNEDRSGFSSQKDYLGVPSRPYAVQLPETQ